MDMFDLILEHRRMYIQFYEIIPRNVVIGKDIYRILCAELRNMLSNETWERVFHTDGAIESEITSLSGMIMYVDWETEFKIEVGVKIINNEGKMKYVRQNNEG